MSSESQSGLAPASWLQRVKSDPALTLALLGLAAAAILGAALLSQYVGGLRPCVMCLYQRMPYAAAIALAVYALAIRAPLGRAGLAASVVLLGLFFLGDFAIAAYHVGIEQKWIEGTASCGAPPLGGATIEDIKRQLLGTPVVRCDEPAWTMFGISMAGYNSAAALMLGLFALGLGRSQWRAR